HPQIYLGKPMASLIPGYSTAAMGFLFYSLVVNLIVGPKLGGWFFPTTNWWILMLWVLPPFIALALAVILAISARVSSAAAAQQASALATLPLIVIAYGVSSNTLFRGSGTAFGIGGLAWCRALRPRRRRRVLTGSDHPNEVKRSASRQRSSVRTNTSRYSPTARNSGGVAVERRNMNNDRAVARVLLSMFTATVVTMCRVAVPGPS